MGKHLYQTYSYMSHSDFPGKINKMLLYPSINHEVDFQYKIDNFIIFIKTINLNEDWKVIENKLIEITKICKI